MQFAFYKAHGASANIWDKLISLWENGPYAHCEVILSGPDDKGLYEIASSKPGKGQGVRITYSALPTEDWDIIESPGNEAAVRQWFVDNAGKVYDYLGLVGFIFRPVPDDKEKYFCSEAIGNALGIKDAWRYDPNSLYSLLQYINVAK